MVEHPLPRNLRYTTEHQWVDPVVTPRPRGAGVGLGMRVGVTAHAQGALGDIVHVSLPEVGARVQAGQRCGELESTTSVSDLFAPLTGAVAARNEALAGSPELVNSDPYGEGWLMALVPDDPAEVPSLLDAASYRSALG